MKQYGAERDGEGPAKRNEQNIAVGKGTKGPSLNGKHTMEDKRKFSDNEPNKVDLDENMALDVRKAVVLDYLEGGGDGDGTDIPGRLSKFRNENPEWIEHSEVDELYPKGGGA